MKKKPEKCVRLMCEECLRDDFDGITEADLEQLKATWEDIVEVQSWHDSITEWTAEQRRQQWESGDERHSLDWETHQGTCPECQHERTAHEHYLFPLRRLF